ncbi:hypothetical protein [Sphingorhabdus sp.]|jgi:hypothetical protein|uniref:hypothetical protein n=1 Tax=Sphingorhabdus sp. TaxID=1902408 RepID=UPI002C2442C5|nr:hypothetical protein [Sphingorhabdus sp.]HMT41944.1 hypothetical protein [Sphingorhabdus sp.]
MRFRPARFAALMLACTAAIATSPAMAQAEPDKNADIVVKGRTEELRYMLKDMLNESASSKQIGRFEQRLCPKVVGFPADWSKMLEDMVRKNATTAGLKLQKEGCEPNAMIIFIDEPQRLVSEMGKALPEFFGHMTEEQRTALSASYRPVYSWRVTDIRSSRGVELKKTDSFNGEASNAYVVRNAQATRTSENTRQDILLSFAVMDIAKTEGKSLRQLADMATMHLLLDLSQEAESVASPDSILTLFGATSDAAALPKRMSVMDKSMLTGTYKFRNNALKAGQQRGMIAKEIKEADEKAIAADGSR